MKKDQTTFNGNEINKKKNYIEKIKVPLDLCFNSMGSRGKYVFSMYLKNLKELILLIK
jgi:hypothetical protein